MKKTKINKMIEYLSPISIFSYFFVHNIFLVLIGIIFSMYLININKISNLIKFINKIFVMNNESIVSNKNDKEIKYKDIFFQAEKEFSAYNFEYANTENLFKIFDMTEKDCKALLEKRLSLPAYDQCLKASHIFNLLDARGVIGVAQRAGYISRIRDLTKNIGHIWLESQKS